MKFRQLTFTIVILLLTINSYSQEDSLQNKKIYSWTLSSFDKENQITDVDTSLASFQNFNPLLQNSITGNYLGNLGSAYQSHIYYDRYAFNTGFIFSQPYSIYFHLPQNQKYYNTKRQFTLLKYSTAGPKNESEQLLKVLHTQNVNEKLNFGIDYDMISSDGRYLNQQVKQNRITLFSSYIGERYSLHSNFNLNRAKIQENGGIDSVQYLNEDEYSKRKNIPIRLTDAKSDVYNTSFYIAHEYRFGKKSTEIKVAEINKTSNDDVQRRKNKNKPDDLEKLRSDSIHLKSNIKFDTLNILNRDSLDILLQDTTNKFTEIIEKFDVNGLSVSHELIYNSDVRKYKDEMLTEEFYNTLDIYMDSLSTSDDVRQRQIGNKLSLNYKFKNKFSSSLSFYNEQMKYEYNVLPDTSFVLNDTIINSRFLNSQSNSNVSFHIKTNLFDQILFKAYAEYFINGYKKENSKIDLKFSYLLFRNTELSLEGEYTNERPDYFYSNYSSNSFIWDNNSLGRIEEWDAGFALRNQKHKFEAKIRYGQITNYTYFDTTAYVKQYNDQINLLVGEISKVFKLGALNSVTRLVYQTSSNDSILSLPEFNVYQSLYFEHLTTFSSTGGKLLWQVGFDYRFAGKYMADAYMPASGVFYKQFDHEQIDYHRLDFFINLTIKRARIYFKYDYLNVVINKNYHFASPYYPVPDPIFKFGFAWSFYD